MSQSRVTLSDPSAPKRRLYPSVEPFARGQLEVGDGHALYWERSGKRGGTGLGLTIARRFAQSMGGQLRATSAPAEGCCFELTLRGANLGGRDTASVTLTNHSGLT